MTNPDARCLPVRASFPLPAPHLVWRPGGTLRMGPDHYSPEKHPVTNATFARFVRATGHVTVAGRAPAGPRQSARSLGLVDLRPRRVLARVEAAMT